MLCVALSLLSIVVNTELVWLLWWSELEGEGELSHRQEPNTARERYTVSEKAVNGYKAAHPWLDEVIVTQEQKRR